jgi:hypothetical protein
MTHPNALAENDPRGSSDLNAHYVPAVGGGLRKQLLQLRLIVLLHILKQFCT